MTAPEPQSITFTATVTALTPLADVPGWCNVSARAEDGTSVLFTSVIPYGEGTTLTVTVTPV